jgi:periplasmic protein TonB
MDRIHFIRQPRADGNPTRRLRAFLASCVFHGLALCLLLGLTFLYRSHMPPLKNGSAPGSPSISLEKMVVFSPPLQSLPPQPPKPATASTPPHALEAKPASPEATVPLLAAQPSKPELPSPAKIQVAVHPAILHPTVATTQSPRQPAASASVSSYAPGPSVLPHPPYPIEARDLRETGIVVMNVQFDVKGDVAQVEVAQSSGVPILDSETQSFIRTHWHSPVYAGQIVSVPVQYTLQNL